MTPREIHEKISELAYLMWEAAGRQQGLTVEYWLAAERQVMAMVEAAMGQMMHPGRAPAQDGTSDTAESEPAQPAQAPAPAVEASPTEPPPVAAEPAAVEPAAAEPVAAKPVAVEPPSAEAPTPAPAVPAPAPTVEETPVSPPIVGPVEHKTRPIVRKDWIGQNVTLDLDTSNGHFIVPHDELWNFVQTHKTVATTKTWQEKGEYSWPKIPSDLLEFLSSYSHN